jgi:hypothetical protein
MNGDGVVGDLMYIPRDDSEIQFVDYKGTSAEEQRRAFWAFVDQDPYLRSHKGRYAGANEARAPLVHRIDLRAAKDFETRIGTFQVSMTVLNVMNIFNGNWGIEQVNSACNGSRILNYEGTDPEGRPRFSMYHASGKMPEHTYEYLPTSSQTWRIQLGIKYFFASCSGSKS